MFMIKLLPIIFVFLCIFGTFASQVSVEKLSSAGKHSILSFENGKETFVSLTEFAPLLGFKFQWDRYSQKLVFTKSNTKLVFTQDLSFYSVNDKVNQLSSVPVRFKGSLYLPVESALQVFKSQDALLSWNDSLRVIRINSSLYSVLSATCDKKQNGTLLTIALGDSLFIDYTYFYPNLTINFFGGTIDTTLVKNDVPCGPVKSIRSVQFKGSAQVSVFLTSEIEEPMVDYVQDAKVLMVSLRQKKKVVPVVPLNTGFNVSGIKNIVLDAGHGGKDPGATGISGVKEKDVTLAVTLQIRDLLKKKGGVNVYLTRDKDVFIPLRDRTTFANDKKADLFISIHADAVPGDKKRKETTRGYKVYFLSQAKNEEDKLVAMRENAVIELEDRPQNYSNLHNVLIDLAGNEYLRESQDLCILLDQHFNIGLKNKISKLHLGVGQANFWILNGAYMPSVLIETGFLSNTAEEKLLSDSKFQKTVAQSIFEAITSFKESYEGGI
jgi:N-acetylmuramoyl-L-alanine amidase